MPSNDETAVAELQLTPQEELTIAEDVRELHGFGYAQELLRRMNGFSNFAISFSIICILAGGITSFQIGFCAVGGAAIGIGWPVCCAFSLLFALAMAQLGSAFPTAGGLYHWASILGGRGWGWATAWFNLIGLVAVLAAINLGTFNFILGWLAPLFGREPADWNTLLIQTLGVCVITFSQAACNHRGIRVTTFLTDFSGYLIFVVVILLTAAMFYFAPTHDFSRLFKFTNYSGQAGGDVWNLSSHMGWLFALSLLLPAYTITGFDASAHTSEETIGASRNVPRGIVNSVLLSGIFGWVMLCSFVIAAADMNSTAAQGNNAFFSIMDDIIPRGMRAALYVFITIAQYLCGLAAVTSGSRMLFAFARDGGVPFSKAFRTIGRSQRTPGAAIWAVSILAVLFTLYADFYKTATAVSAIFLYVSYLIPIALGLFAFRRSWTRMGPWDLGGLYRPIAVLCIVGCAVLIVIGVATDWRAQYATGGAVVLTMLVWFAFERRHFKGPPQGTLDQHSEAAIAAAEQAVGQITHGAIPVVTPQA